MKKTTIKVKIIAFANKMKSITFFDKNPDSDSASILPPSSPFNGSILNAKSTRLMQKYISFLKRTNTNPKNKFISGPDNSETIFSNFVMFSSYTIPIVPIISFTHLIFPPKYIRVIMWANSCAKIKKNNGIYIPVLSVAINIVTADKNK